MGEEENFQKFVQYEGKMSFCCQKKAFLSGKFKQFFNIYEEQWDSPMIFSVRGDFLGGGSRSLSYTILAFKNPFSSPISDPPHIVYIVYIKFDICNGLSWVISTQEGNNLQGDLQKLHLIFQNKTF